MAYDAIDAHEDDPTYQDFADAMNPDFILSREVQPLDGRYPGRIEKHFNKRGVEYRHQRRMYNVRYYNDSLPDECEVDENGKPLKNRYASVFFITQKKICFHCCWYRMKKGLLKKMTRTKQVVEVI